MAKALEESYSDHIFRERLDVRKSFELSKLTELGMIINDCHGDIINIRFDGANGQTLAMLLSEKSVYVSTGAACESGKDKPSRALLAIGLTPKQAKESIRISFSDQNTQKDVQEVIDAIYDTVKTVWKK